MAKDDLVYVTYTCKNKSCQKAFIDLDPKNEINDTPRTSRYCPECEKKIGTKNKPLKVPKKQKHDTQSVFFKAEIKARNIFEDKDIKFLKSEFFKIIHKKEQQGKRIILKYVFDEAMEILSYQDWK